MKHKIAISILVAIILVVVALFISSERTSQNVFYPIAQPIILMDTTEALVEEVDKKESDLYLPLPLVYYADGSKIYPQDPVDEGLLYKTHAWSPSYRYIAFVYSTALIGDAGVQIYVFDAIEREAYKVVFEDDAPLAIGTGGSGASQSEDVYVSWKDGSLHVAEVYKDAPAIVYTSIDTEVPWIVAAQE